MEKHKTTRLIKEQFRGRLKDEINYSIIQVNIVYICHRPEGEVLVRTAGETGHCGRHSMFCFIIFQTMQQSQHNVEAA